jgi:dihydrodipicolinate synthase/N-acetylneuraminate lyase
MKDRTMPTGVLAPVVTPLTAEHELDEEALERLLAFFVAHETGLFLLGTTAEGASLPDDMQRTIVARATAMADGRVPVFASVADTCLQRSVARCHAWAKLGVDGVFAHMPPYYPLTESEIESYFRLLADATPVALTLYNIPQATRVSIPVDVVDRLSRHPSIVAIKDSERDQERLDRSLQLWGGSSDFHFLAGWAARSSYACLRGAQGLVPGSANVAPWLYHAMIQAAFAGDEATANDFQERTNAISRCFQEGFALTESFAALKYMMHLLGFCQPHMMPPILELGESGRAAVQKAMSAVEHLFSDGLVPTAGGT